MRFGHLVLAFVFVGAVAGGWNALGADKMKHDERPVSLARRHPWRKADGLGERAERQDASASSKPIPTTRPITTSLLKVLDATDRIPFGTLDHQYVFNFWQDAQQSQGHLAAHDDCRLRRTRSPHWEMLLDLDKLAADEHENWVLEGRALHAGADALPDRLSRGGGDAVVVREFDLATKSS